MDSIFDVSDVWRASFPGACAGALAMSGIINPARQDGLEKQKAAISASLREQWGGKDRAAIAENPVLQAYREYYRRFDKTYHVQLQLESIVLKGKPLPAVSGLVDAMFAAEVENLLLTAGHDLNLVRLPVWVDAARGDERYTVLRGQEQVLKAGDMMMVDGEGVISSILYGPDQRTQISIDTREVIYTVYAPQGIGAPRVQSHLETIEKYVRLFAPEARTSLLRIWEA